MPMSETYFKNNLWDMSNSDYSNNSFNLVGVARALFSMYIEHVHQVPTDSMLMAGQSDITSSRS